MVSCRRSSALGSRSSDDGVAESSMAGMGGLLSGRRGDQRGGGVQHRAPRIAQTGRGSQPARRIDLARMIWHDRRARALHPQRGAPPMRQLILFVAVCLLLSGPFQGVVSAHRQGDPPHQLYQIGDFSLESGQVIKDFAISYVTHGTLNAKKSNVILMVTALTGNHHRLDFLIGPGKALDTNKYYIVATDAIGNGSAQPRMQFPLLGMRDMVQSQYRLLKDELGIDHMVAVVGPSMGGMQALQWGGSYPEVMDSLVALVPLARTPAWSVVIVDASRKAIMLDPAWK